MGPESVLSTQTGIRPVTVSLPSQTNPNLLKNPHLSPLEKRLGVILLNSKTVKASFNAFFFNGDQIISVNRKNLQSMTAQDLNRSDLEVTVIPGLKHVDRHSIVKLEQISRQHNSLSDGQKNIINSNFHVFSENKRIVSVENCKTAKPKDHLIRGLYTLTTTAEKMLKNEKSDKIDKPDNLQDPLKPTNSAKSSHSRSNSPLFDDIFKENSHMALPYTDKDIIDDAALLIIHYVKRMSNINKDEKTKMKAVINRLQSGFLNCRNLFTFITQNSSFEVIFEANKCNSRPKFWV